MTWRPLPRALRMGLTLSAATVMSGVASRAGWAQTPLPYSTRLRGYSAWDTSVRGDLRTVGMAGAMVGLADSHIGAVDNPAGLAMTVRNGGLQFSGSAIQDGYVQTYPALIQTRSLMATVNAYPWGASFASWTPQSEADVYLVGAASEEATLAVTTHEYRLSAARVAFNDRLSLGLTLILGQNTQSVLSAVGPSLSRSVWGFGVGVGLLYQLPNRVLLGMSYTPPIHYQAGTGDEGAVAVQNFFQPASSPYRLGLGAGWVPNRFFRCAAGMYLVGTTDDVALLSDQNRLVGQDLTLQPRVGFSYLLAEFKELVIELSAGSYVEVMRVADTKARLHGTLGLEIRPWIFSFGWGLDEARLYQNFSYSGAIDLGKLLRKLDILPRDRQTSYAGFLPNPARLSDESLPRALVKDWREEAAASGVIDVGLGIPSKVRDRILHAPDQVRKLGEDMIESIEHFPAEVGGEGGR